MDQSTIQNPVVQGSVSLFKCLLASLVVLVRFSLKSCLKGDRLLPHHRVDRRRVARGESIHVHPPGRRVVHPSECGTSTGDLGVDMRSGECDTCTADDMVQYVPVWYKSESGYEMR